MASSVVKLSRRAFLAILALTALGTCIITTLVLQIAQSSWRLHAVRPTGRADHLRFLQPRTTGFYLHALDGRFHTKARMLGADKANVHAVYQSYFELRPGLTRVHKMLEIGRGCNMDTGPARSTILWRAYMPLSTDIWAAEHNSTCVDKHRAQYDSLYFSPLTGDASDPRTLHSWIHTSKGNFDLIIDNGGHSNMQVYTAFMILFQHALNPGGIYVIESLSVSRVAQYQGGPRDGDLAMVDVIRDWIEALLTFPAQGMEQRREIAYKLRHRMPPGIKRIDCTQVACAVVKCYADDLDCNYGSYVDPGLLYHGHA